MNILLLGSGGREHALAWKMKESKHCTQLFIAPGNAGTAQYGMNLPVGVNDFEDIAKACKKYFIDMLVVGSEEPLVKGIRDYLQQDNELSSMMIIGPGKSGARLEGSKDFSKAFMQRHNIPTAAYASFTKDTLEEGRIYLSQHSTPIVLKADGLAAGKGVVICATKEEAISTFEEMIVDQKFGAASNKVVVEEFLTGIEMSVFVIVNGEDYVLLPNAKDYKKIGVGETGLNTGGMGAISPVPFCDERLLEKIKKEIIEPTVLGLKKENIAYCGIIFIGLIVENGNAKVIEYNCRLGDPETEVVLPRLENDLVEVFMATAKGNLKNIFIKETELHAAGTVAVSGGYPRDYAKGFEIELPKMTEENDHIFYAGVKNADEKIVTDGGRVLVVVSLAPSLHEAAKKSRRILSNTNFNEMYYRNDIGFEFEK